MADNVVRFPGITSHDLPPETVYDMAKEADLQDIVIIGWDADGHFYYNATTADSFKALWLLEKAKQALLNAGDDDA